MKCSYCGNELQEQDSVCSFCGKPVEESKEAEEGKESLTEEKAEGTAESKEEAGEEEKKTIVEEAGVEKADAGSDWQSPGEKEPEGGDPGTASVGGASLEPPKKKNGAKLAVIAAAAAAVVGIGAFAAVKMMEKDPKEVVIAAFENIYTEDQVDPLEELFGLSEFGQYTAADSQQVTTELVLENCSEEAVNRLAGGGIRTDVRFDNENQKGSLDLAILFNNMDLAKLNLYYGDRMIMAAVPELSSKVFTLDVGEGLADRLKNSPTLGPVLEDSDVDVEELADFYEEYMAWIQAKLEDGTSSDPYGLKDVWKRYQEGSQAQENFKAALTVEKAGKGTFQMDGKEVSCKGYQVHVSKDSLISFLRTSADFFLEDEELKENFLENLRISLRLTEIIGGTDATEALGGLSAEEQLNEGYEQVRQSVDEAIDTLDEALGDVEMLVHVDPKGRLASVEGNTSVKARGEVIAVDFSLALQGGSYLTQNAQAKVVLAGDGENFTMELLKQGTYDQKSLTGDIALDLYGDGDGEHIGLMFGGTYDAESGDFSLRAEGSSAEEKVLGLSAAGVVSELEKGSVLHVDMDEIRVDVPSSEVLNIATGDVYVTFSGEYDLRPLSGEVTEPEGEKLDIVAATEEDWQQVMMEAYLGIMDIASQLGSVMN